MTFFEFPAKPESTSGSEARFRVDGATIELASFLNGTMAGDERLSKYEVLVTSNRPDCVTVIGSDDIPRSQFKADMAALAAQFSCIYQGDVDAYIEQARRRTAAAMATHGSSSEGLVSKAGNVG